MSAKQAAAVALMACVGCVAPRDQPNFAEGGTRDGVDAGALPDADLHADTASARTDAAPASDAPAASPDVAPPPPDAQRSPVDAPADPGKPPAAACSAGSECASGRCTDGHCCVATCQVCETCTGPGGTCAGVFSGPDDLCPLPNVCFGPGVCKLPGAQSRLDDVAGALVSAKERTVLVEGHTDSRGGRDANMALSQRRAEAVRSYLVSRGYPAEKIEARGIGQDRPVGENGTPEGRANNRRVEIVVERASHSSLP